MPDKIQSVLNKCQLPAHFVGEIFAQCAMNKFMYEEILEHIFADCSIQSQFDRYYDFISTCTELNEIMEGI